MCCRRHVRTAKGPCCQERTVLLEQDAVINQGIVEQQIGKAVCFDAVLGNSHITSNCSCTEEIEPRGHSSLDKTVCNECVADRRAAREGRISPFWRAR